MIFLEIISNDKQEKEKNVKKNNKKTNSIAFKYMNVLGYFLPDSKTLQRNENNFGAFKISCPGTHRGDRRGFRLRLYGR